MALTSDDLTKLHAKAVLLWNPPGPWIRIKAMRRGEHIEHIEHIGSNTKQAILYCPPRCPPASSSQREGVYQMGDDQARSWIVACMSGRGFTPARIASQVDQRQTGFSNTRA